MKKLLPLLVASLVVAGCATTQETQYQGIFVKKDQIGQLEPGKNKGTLRWFSPDANVAKYNKFMVDYVVFGLAPDAEYKGIDAEEMKKLADAASTALVQAIQKKYPVVAEPGPDVMRIRVAIVDLKPSRPAVSAITSVLPAGLAISLVKKGATDQWSGGGLTKAEIVGIDSMTNRPVAVAYADYNAQFTERFTSWGSVEDAFNYWGERATTVLTSFKEGKPDIK